MLRDKVEVFRAAVKPARTTVAETLYLYDAVLVPRVLYALVLATLPEKEVHGMESRVWLWQASKLGMAPCQARALLHMEPEYGGLGVEAWLSRATRRKAELAMQWRSGGVPEHAAQLAVMRLDHDRTHPRQRWRGSWSFSRDSRESG